MKYRHLAEFLPLWDLDADCVIATDGVFWGGGEIEAPDCSSETVEMWRELEARLHASAASLPDGLRLQMIHEQLPGSCRSHVPAPASDGGDPHTLQRRTREAFIASRSMTRRLSVYWTTDTLLTRAEFKAFDGAAFRSRVRRAEVAKETVAGFLGSIGVGLRRFRSEELTQEFLRALSPLEPVRPLVELVEPIDTSLRHRLIREEASRDTRFFRYGDAFFRVLSIRHFPRDTSIGAWMGLDALCDVPMRVVTHVHVPPRSMTNFGFRQRRRIAHSLLSRSGPADTEGEIGLDEMQDLDVELVTGAKLTRCGAQLVLVAPSLKELDRNTRRVRDGLVSVDLELAEETGGHDEEFCKSLPGMGGRFDRWKLVSSKVAANFVPMVKRAAGDEDPQLTFVHAADRTPFGYSLRSRRRANDNFQIFGASGAGKSVLLNMLVAYEMLYGPHAGRILAVDYAGPEKSSLLVAQEVFGGRYYSMVKGTRLNPFPTKREAWRHGSMEPSAFGFIVGVCNTLLVNTTESKESALFEAIVQRAIVELYDAWENDAAPRFGDLLKFLQRLLAKPDADRDRLSVLITLVKKLLAGPEAELLNAHTNLGDPSALTVFDLYGLREYAPRVKAAVAATVMRYVRTAAFDGRTDAFKYVLFEEVSNLLALSPLCQDLVMECATTARAHGISVGLVNQEYAEFRSCGIAGKLNLNCTTKFLMSHENAQDAMTPIVEDVGLNSAEEALFRSLRAVKGEYSELLVKTKCPTPQGTQPVTAKLRFELSPLDYWVVTSDGRDRAKIRRLEKRFPEVPKLKLLQALAREQEVRG